MRSLSITAAQGYVTLSGLPQAELSESVGFELTTDIGSKPILKPLVWTRHVLPPAQFNAWFLNGIPRPGKILHKLGTSNGFSDSSSCWEQVDLQVILDGCCDWRDAPNLNGTGYAEQKAEGIFRQLNFSAICPASVIFFLGKDTALPSFDQAS
ncbi:hypothetical protein [uncultured Tateyamaria sp.]|uniref:hypothetical protein n=1 Tax=uncultured Tateyamaria sp. TaxID=455651 RepID=UPI00260ED0EE|nr:hypothetical protein [uncultured Tateyamaria sp.]